MKNLNLYSKEATSVFEVEIYGNYRSVLWEFGSEIIGLLQETQYKTSAESYNGIVFINNKETKEIKVCWFKTSEIIGGEKQLPDFKFSEIFLDKKYYSRKDFEKDFNNKCVDLINNAVPISVLSNIPIVQIKI